MESNEKIAFVLDLLPGNRAFEFFVDRHKHAGSNVPSYRNRQWKQLGFHGTWDSKLPHIHIVLWLDWLYMPREGYNI